MAPPGFNWQVSQPALASTYYATANRAGLYTQTQYNKNRAAALRTRPSSPRHAISSMNSSTVTAAVLRLNRVPCMAGILFLIHLCSFEQFQGAFLQAESET